MEDRRPADPSAREVLERWAALEPLREGQASHFEDRDSVVQLITDHLDSYAYELLSKSDLAWWETRRNEDEETGAFSLLFGPEWIVHAMDEFLGWFLIRKVMASKEETGVFAMHCGELATWLGAEGVVRAADAEAARARAVRAADELPAAAELGELLYSSGKDVDFDRIAEARDWVDEMATIVRVAPGGIWFRSESGEKVGPVRVRERAVEIARVGWKVSAADLVRVDDDWFMLEIGNVYPD